MSTIHAVYENGVFRPKQPVELPERCEVEFEPRIVQNGQIMTETIDAIYAILGERFDTGVTDAAERHNEHQP